MKTCTSDILKPYNIRTLFTDEKLKPFFIFLDFNYCTRKFRISSVCRQKTHSSCVDSSEEKRSVISSDIIYCTRRPTIRRAAREALRVYGSHVL